MQRNSRQLFLLSASARAHAQAALHRQRPVVAVDGFLDADLAADEVVRTHLEDGQFTSEVLGIVSRLSHSGDRLAYGSGFEADPGLLDQLRMHVQVLGNSPDVVHLCADPVRLSERFLELGISGPEIHSERPENLEGWLVKRKGRSGGGHVHPASRVAEETEDDCWQRQCAGESYSALFLAGEGRAHIVGVSRLLPSGRMDAPHVWSGAVGPVEVLPEVFEQVQWTVQTLTRGLNLLGICGIDFIVDSEHRIQVVDLNPRLVATCELYADRFSSDYMSAHLETCLTGCPDGRLIPGASKEETVRGLKVVYAPRPIGDASALIWPDGTADLPRAGVGIDVGQPLCTVRGCYRNPDAARVGLQDLSQRILRQLSPDSLQSFSPRSLVH